MEGEIMLDVSKVKAILSKAAYWDMDFPIFGSNCHTHLLNAPLSIEELEIWEELMQITLPADYRTYLTILGNGGAGPAYGISSFSFPLDETLLEQTVYSDDAQPQFEQLAHQWYEYSNEDEDELYREYCLRTDGDKQMSFEVWDNNHWEVIDCTVRRFLFQTGQLFIANQGCSHDVYLLLNGSHRGMCNYSNEEYDYSYPFWYENADDHHSITWPQYRSTLVSFEDYFMRYVDQAEEVCASLTFEKKEQFHRERIQVLAFHAAVQEQDWNAVLSMLTKLCPSKLSTKSRRFYIYYQQLLESKLPQRPEISHFFQQMQHSHKYNYPEWSYIKDVDEILHNDVCPSFQDFLQSFYKSDE